MNHSFYEIYSPSKKSQKMTNIVCTVQLGNQLGMCLLNNSKGKVQSILPTYDEKVGDTEICTNMIFYGDYTISPGKYHMIIIELPKVDHSILGYLRYSVDNTSNKLKFDINPASELDDIDTLKKMLLEKFQKIIDNENTQRDMVVKNAIETLKHL